MKTAAKKRGSKLIFRKGKMDITFLVLVLLLLTFGLVMLFSASYAYAYYHEGNSFHYIARQLVFAVAGVVAMIIVSMIDYHILHRFTWIILGISIVLLVVVLFCPPINNAKRWIPVFSLFNFQPSEIAKFAVVVTFAHLISINYNKMKTVKYGILPFVAILAVIAVLMLQQPHLSGTILICLIGAVMMFIGGTDIKWFLLAGAAGVAGIIIMVMIPGVVEYAGSRFAYWLDPFSDPLGKGFQVIQSLYAIGSGGLLGTGIGQSRQKYLYLPEVQNDFVFAVVCEELGFVGAVIIIILFFLLIWRGFVIASKAKDKFGAMIAVGLTTQVGVQAILNIAVVTNTIPNTGISMPFFSYGGTSLMMLLAQMGVVLGISRQANLVKE